MAVWMSWNIDIPRISNSRDSFPRRKFKNRAQISCSPDAILPLPTYSFELHAKTAEEIDLEMCSYGQLLEVQMLLPWPCPWPWIGSRSHQHTQTCRTTSIPNHVTVASRSTEIWPFEFSEIWTFGKVWSHVIAFLEGNSKITLRQPVVQVPYYHHQPSVLSSTQKTAEKIDLEMCSYGQLSEVQMLRDLDLDLGSGQGHINIHSTCRTTSIPNHVTVATRSTEIWPFEFREIWTFGEVWTLVIAFLERNSKIELWQAVVQVPYYGHQPSVLSSMQKRRRR